MIANFRVTRSPYGEDSDSRHCGVIDGGCDRAVTLIWLPVYRLFLAISVGIGLVVAGILYLWRKLRPVHEEEVENKRPLGLM